MNVKHNELELEPLGKGDDVKLDADCSHNQKRMDAKYYKLELEPLGKGDNVKLYANGNVNQKRMDAKHNKSELYTLMNRSKSCLNEKRTCQLKHLSTNNQSSKNQINYNYRTNDNISVCDSEISMKYVISEPRKRSKYNTNHLDTTVTINDLIQSITKINLNAESHFSTSDNAFAGTKENKLSPSLGMTI
jgi:hypothetical protein